MSCQTLLFCLRSSSSFLWIQLRTNLSESLGQYLEFNARYSELVDMPQIKIFEIFPQLFSDGAGGNGYDFCGSRRTYGQVLVSAILGKYSPKMRDIYNYSIGAYQALGFLMTSLHNFMVQYGVACLAFTQLNRDGITREDTDVASGSDRILWLCSNFSIYKRKTEEEMADESVSQNNVSYNLKLIPVVARHGKGIDAGDYINISGNYEYGRITEGPTRNEFHQLRSTRINNGFQIEELPDEISATN